MAQRTRADGALLLVNARVLTLDEARPHAEAVAIAGGRIVVAGTAAEARGSLAGAVELIDCGGRLVLPGLIDAHAHLLAQATSEEVVDCSATAAGSIEAIVAALRRRTPELPAGAWLFGRGYHEAALSEQRQPTRRDLDRAAADRPIRLIHASGHASVLNSAGLAAAGIAIESEEPPGAAIERELETGEPNGLLIEMEDRLDRLLPRPEPAALAAAVQRLSARLLAAGVTAVHDLGHRNDGERARLWSELVSSGHLLPRLTLATGYEAFATGDSALAAGVRPGPVKLMLNETGERLLPEPHVLAARVLAVHRAGRQAAIHATQPRAIVAALDAIEAAQAADPRPDPRHRLEHASLTPPPLVARIARLGAVVVSNPAFLSAHGDRYLRIIPRGEQPWLSDTAGLVAAGVRVAAGSDCPVAPPEPALGIAAAQGRRTREGRRVPGGGLTFEQAVALYTRNAACADFAEGEYGRIRAGFAADLVLLDGAPPALQPLLTVLGGAVVWRRAGW